MKQIRMITTAAGPAGNMMAGNTYTVKDSLAAALANAGAAEIIATITDTDLDSVLSPDKETAATAGAPERPTRRRKAPRKTAKKSTSGGKDSAA